MSTPRSFISALLLGLVLAGVPSALAAVSNIAYWRFGENDAGASNGATPASTVDTAARVLPLVGAVKYTNGVAPGAAANAGSTLGLHFPTLGQGRYPTLVTSLTDNFGIELWVRPEAPAGTTQCLAYNGHTGANGWGIYISNGKYNGLFGGVAFIGSANAVAGQWTHLALVRAGGVASFYVDGIRSGGTVANAPQVPAGVFTVGVQPQTLLAEWFRGEMDEVRVFSFAPGGFDTNDLLHYNRQSPVVTTTPATSVAYSSATLNGTVHPGNLATLAWFEWGTSLSYGNTTAPTALPAALTAQALTFNAPGLAPVTTYHFRAVATNALGITFGPDLTFTTAPEPKAPVATTTAANSITFASARLNGTVHPGNLTTTTAFEWGATPGYGNFTDTGTVNPANSAQPVTFNLTGLAAGTYHYRVRATNSLGVSLGQNVSFVIPVQLRPPSVTTTAATDLSDSRATLNGTVNPGNLPTAAWFEWAINPDLGLDRVPIGAPLPAGNSAQAVSGILPGLTPATTYQYRTVASNSLGLDLGPFTSFTTPATFTAVPLPGVPGVDYGAGTWGDFDSDGRLDFLLTGHDTVVGALTQFSQLWRNTPDGFSNVTSRISPELPRVWRASSAWGDYNNDGRLDLLHTGARLDGSSSLFRGIPNGRNSDLTDVTASAAPGLPGVYMSAVAWGDFDNDGRLDFILTGYSSLVTYSQLWRNTGTGFVNVTASLAPDLPGAARSAVAWADYDNDGRLDFILTGGGDVNLESQFSQIWRNTGQGFSNVTATVAPDLPGAAWGSVAWGDYDNDGRLDFLLTGLTNGLLGERISQIWRNTGSGFVQVTAQLAAGLPGVAAGSAAWGDYDNDGRLDILLTGDNRLEVWRNTGSGFSNVTAGVAADVRGVSLGAAAWGDYDNDGRLDFFLTGSSTGAVAQLWRNNTAATNAPPSAPAGLVAGSTNDLALLFWEDAVDDHTPAAGLSYNLRAGSVPGGTNLLSGHVDRATGFRRVPALGNAGLCRSHLLAGLTNGQVVYWSVQAVDTSFAGGAFAQENVFIHGSEPASAPIVTTAPPDAIVETHATLRATVHPGYLATVTWFEWGPTTNYGSATAPTTLAGTNGATTLTNRLSGLALAATYHYRVAASNAMGISYGANVSFLSPTFARVDPAAFHGGPPPPIFDGSVAWGDYDNDSRLDLVLVGNGISQLWRNSSTGFVQVTASVAPGLAKVYGASVAWADFNNDGRLDLLVTGATNSSRAPIQLWQNTDGRLTNVTDQIAPGLQGVVAGQVAWGDYDGDGRLDLLLTGAPNDQGAPPVTQLWRNTRGGFVDVTSSVAPGLPGLVASSVAWADFDQDGRLDFLLAGNDPTNTYVSQIWRNTGDGFVPATDSLAPGLPGVLQRNLSWADYDNDGRPDFLLSGLTPSGSPISQLWRNTGSGFTNATATAAPGLPGIYDGSARWADYDNDGWMDFLLMGLDEHDAPVLELWRNTGAGFVETTDLVAPGLPAILHGTAAWADFDQDGRLDLFLTGTSTSGQGISQVWRNGTALANHPPAAPTGLVMTASATAAMLSWNAAKDDHTPDIGLSYNVRAGTTPGGTDLLAGHVDGASGARRVPAQGNAGPRQFLPLTGLTNGQTIYWSVQAVDTSFAGGPFATETSVVTQPQLTLTPVNAISALLEWSPPTWGWVLEVSDTLNPSSWTPAPSRDVNPVLLHTTNGIRLHRLSAP